MRSRVAKAEPEEPQGLIANLEAWSGPDATRFEMRQLAVVVARYYEQAAAAQVALAQVGDDLDDWVSADAAFEKGRIERESIVTRLSLDIPELVDTLRALKAAL
jgi:hypothetical protein